MSVRRTFLRRGRPAALIVALACAANGVAAMSLAEAFDAALAHDPQYRAAGHDLDAARQSVPLARAGLLPQVQLSLSNADVSGKRDFQNSLNQDVSVRLDYATPQSALSLRQSLFNYENLYRYRQAEASTRNAEETFRVRGLGLVDRLASAYLQALVARSALAVFDAEIQAAQAVATRAEQRLQRGEGTRTEVAQARASIELARARQAEAGDTLTVALVRLQRLTGRSVAWLNDLPAGYRPLATAIEPLDHWQTLALQQNPQIQARREAITAARAAVQRNVAGHLPRLDLVASMSRNRNESVSNLNETRVLRSVGLQLSVPIFSGGAVQASVRQAESEALRAEEELRADIEGIGLDVQRLHAAVLTGVARVDALGQLISANETALLGVTRAREAGLATDADVLEAQSRLFAAQRDAAQARYEHLGALMRLLVTCGTAMSQVVDTIGRELQMRVEPLALKP